MVTSPHVALMARDRGARGLVFQYQAYPVTDAAMDTASFKENATSYGLTAEAMRWFWDQYVPDEAERLNPLGIASPLS